jgi:hypothetical protein
MKPWALGIACALLIFGGAAAAQTGSGLQLEVAVDSDHADLSYTLGTEPVKLFVKISNLSGGPLATARGFSQVELYNALVVTDPSGGRNLSGSEGSGHKMPPPYFINGIPWGLAETLPGNWVRTATVNDLRDMVPAMKTTAGWYTIEARTSFIRFASTGQDAGLGLIGLLDHTGNWTGAVVSKKLQIYIAPARGAKMKVQVLESKSSVLNPLAQVPVKVFKAVGDANFNAGCDLSQDGTVNQEDLAAFAPLFGAPPAAGSPADPDRDGDFDGSDLAAMAAAFGSSGPNPQALWEGAQPVLTGATDFEGWSVWETGLACLKEDAYVAVAYHSGAYGQSTVATGDSAGWNVSCDDSIVRKITFGTPPATASGDLNGDGCVDMADYDLLIEEIAKPPPHNLLYDLNTDGLVNIADARTLVLLFTNPGGASCP